LNLTCSLGQEDSQPDACPVTGRVMIGGSRGKSEDDKRKVQTTRLGKGKKSQKPKRSKDSILGETDKRR